MNVQCIVKYIWGVFTYPDQVFEEKSRGPFPLNDLDKEAQAYRAMATKETCLIKSLNWLMARMSLALWWIPTIWKRKSWCLLLRLHGWKETNKLFRLLYHYSLIRYFVLGFCVSGHDLAVG